MGFKAAFKRIFRGIKATASLLESPAGKLIMGGAVIATGGAAAPLALWIGRAAHLSTKAVLLAEEAIPENGAGAARAAYAAQHVAESPDTKDILADLRELLGKDADPEAVDDLYESLNETGHKLAKLLGALEKKTVN